jgi:hypothetical protein
MSMTRGRFSTGASASTLCAGIANAAQLSPDSRSLAVEEENAG